MKYIIAIIQPDRVQDVLAKLEEKEIHLVTVSQVLGRGRQKGIAEVYRSHKEPGNLLKKVKLEIAVNTEFVAATIEAITTGLIDRPEYAIARVWPSGAALATTSSAMLPPAPPRFSTSTCPPRRSASRAAMARATISVVPPAAAPTSMRTGLEG